MASFWYRFGRFIVSLLARGILEMSVHWKAPLPQGAVIFAANHPSTIDPAILTTLIGDQMSILIRESVFKVPLFGRSLRMCGHVPVVYGSGQMALDKALHLLKAGRSVVIFPEGEISPTDGGFNRPRSGLARLALCSGVPVVPLGIYLDQKQIRQANRPLGDDKEVGAWYFHGPYAVTVGEALSFRGDVENHELVKQVSAQIMGRIISLAGESAMRVRMRRKMNWLTTTRWWLWSPVRLIRSWYALQGVKTY